MWPSAIDGVRLLSHSFIKALAVRFRVPDDSFVKAGHGMSFRSSGAAEGFRVRGVASTELLSVKIRITTE